MDREEAIALLKEQQGGYYSDKEHKVADKVLCDLLVSLGYADVVAEWDKIGKWYI